MNWNSIPDAERLARLETELARVLAAKQARSYRSSTKRETDLRCLRHDIEVLLRRLAGEKPSSRSYVESNPQMSTHISWRRSA